MPAAAADIVRWEDPAPARAGRKPGPVTEPADPHVAVAAKLRAKPGRWAVVAEVAVNGSAWNLVNYVRHGRTAAWMPAGAFEATSRKTGDHTLVYARYVGDPEQQS